MVIAYSISRIIVLFGANTYGKDMMLLFAFLGTEYGNGYLRHYMHHEV
jgi:hypothetical protein